MTYEEIGRRLMEHYAEFQAFRDELHEAELHRLRAEDETVIGRYLQENGE